MGYLSSESDGKATWRRERGVLERNEQLWKEEKPLGISHFPLLGNASNSFQGAPAQREPPIIPSCLIMPHHGIPTFPRLFSQNAKVKGTNNPLHYPATKFPLFSGFSPKMPRSRAAKIPSCLIILTQNSHFSLAFLPKRQGEGKEEEAANSTWEVRAGFGMKNSSKKGIKLGIFGPSIPKKLPGVAEGSTFSY